MEPSIPIMKLCFKILSRFLLFQFVWMSHRCCRKALEDSWQATPAPAHGWAHQGQPKLWPCSQVRPKPQRNKPRNWKHQRLFLFFPATANIPRVRSPPVLQLPRQQYVSVKCTCCGWLAQLSVTAGLNSLTTARLVRRFGMSVLPFLCPSNRAQPAISCWDRASNLLV